MSKRYTSGVVSSTSPTVNAAGASGVFTLNQQSAAQSTNNWPPYKIEESLRFRNSASARLTRTPAVAGNKQIWTMSFWLKTSKSNFDYYLFESSTDGGNNERTVLAFNSGKLQFRHIDGGSAVLSLETSQVFRDPSAWYHIVLAVDTTQATSSNRVKMYLNGSQITAFGTSTYPNQNLNTDWNGATAHAFGASTYPDSYADGYFSEIYNIDGQALTPSSFGATDKDGNWSPIAYTGTYGTNGFYVNFRDSTSATTMGYDYSGNGNNWTLSGFNVSTANTSYDIMIDVPEDQSDGTANNRGNYCVLNAVSSYSGLPIINGNIQTSAVPSGADWFSRSATMGFSSGKIYAEFSMPSITSGAQGTPVGFGIIPASNDFSAIGQLVGDANRGYGFYCPDTSGAQAPLKRVAGTNSSIGTASATTITDIFMVAFDLTNGNAWFGKNGTWYAGDPAAGTSASITGITAGEYLFGLSVYRDTTYTNNTAAINFGQRPFAYEPPSGFKTLNTFNLPEPTIKQPNKQFDATLWTGNGASSRTITNAGGFQPDFVWVKNRATVISHSLYDAIRGVGNNKELVSDSTLAEGGGNQDEYGYLSAFNSNGFTGVDGSSSPNYYFNENGSGFVAWQWNAGGSTVTNTSGSITSNVRANPTAGFSIVTYTGNGTSGATVGHGLGVAPSMYIVKVRSTTESWITYHTSIGATNYLALNLTQASSAATAAWNNTAPTSTVFSLGNAGSTNGSGSTFVAYCFAPIAGYSAFGSYTGNGSSDGPFIYTGFRPRFVMIKRTDAVQQWWITDTARNPSNTCNLDLFANLTNAEENNGYNLDLLSNGVKIKTSTNDRNASSGTYIYMAFAEMPFKYARAR